MLCYVSGPVDPDPKPPPRIRNNRWQYFRFASPLHLSVANLSKLARAIDPKVASLAIYQDRTGRPAIWGVIDQFSMHSSRYVTWESEHGPQVPGLFQMTITGVGAISVFREYALIANLRQNSIIEKHQNVLWHGPIHDQLMKYMGPIVRGLNRKMGNQRAAVIQWPEYLKNLWLSSLCRILLAIQRYGHGGALLIAPKRSYDQLKVNYRLRYDRLPKILLKYAYSGTRAWEAQEEIVEKHFGPNAPKKMPLDLHLEASIFEDEKHDCQSALAGCAGLIASLSGVDGLVLMDSSLAVQGFGVEITANKDISRVYVAKTARVTAKGLQRRKAESYGTRHRSMMRFCTLYPESVGFVVSQDGPVRAIKKVGAKLVMWDDIQLHHFFEIKRD
jgi:hypothetical protein